MNLSVILCTWNNCQRLAITLEAISHCMIPSAVKWEFIVVNNNCTDNTRRVVRSFEKKMPLLYVEEPKQGLSRAKNAALKVASGQLIVFTDDDVRPCAGWLRTYWRAYEERPSNYFFGGPVISEYEQKRPDSELLRVAPWTVVGLDWGLEARALPSEQRFLGANWACPAAALRKVGLFNVSLGLDASLRKRRIGEEFDLMNRLRKIGMSAWYLPQAVVQHFVPEKKCNIHYIAENAEAQGLNAFDSPVVQPFVYYRPQLKSLCQLKTIPCLLYWKTIIIAIHWFCNRLLQRKGYEDYLTLRFCMGLIKAFHKKLQTKWTTLFCGSTW